jgi:hypothetical protein
MWRAECIPSTSRPNECLRALAPLADYTGVSAHSTSTELGQFSSGRFHPAVFSRVQRHLLKCPLCLQRLIDLELAIAAIPERSVDDQDSFSVVTVTADRSIRAGV